MKKEVTKELYLYIKEILLLKKEIRMSYHNLRKQTTAVAKCLDPNQLQYKKYVTLLKSNLTDYYNFVDIVNTILTIILQHITKFDDYDVVDRIYGELTVYIDNYHNFCFLIPEYVLTTSKDNGLLYPKIKNFSEMNDDTYSEYVNMIMFHTTKIEEHIKLLIKNKDITKKQWDFIKNNLVIDNDCHEKSWIEDILDNDEVVDIKIHLNSIHDLESYELGMDCLLLGLLLKKVLKEYQNINEKVYIKKEDKDNGN